MHRAESELEADPATCRETRILVTVLLLCAALVYLGGIVKNLPYAPEMDEAALVVPAARMATEGDANPRWFGNPGSTVIYPLAILYRSEYGTTPLGLRQTNLTALYLPARLLTASYGIGTILLVFLCGRRLFGTRAAFAGAWLFLFSLLAVSHFQLVRSDSAAAFFGWASLYQLSRLYDRPDLRNTLLTGALIGLGISSRYFMVTFLFPFALVAWLRLWPVAGARSALTSILLGALAALSVFAVTSPFFVLDFSAALSNLRTEARLTHLGADGLTPPQNVLYYLLTALPVAITWPQTIATAVGLILAARRRHTLALVLAATAFVYIGAISMSALHWARWIIQILPVFTLLAGYTLVEVADRITSRAVTNRVLYVLGLLALSAVPMVRVTLHDIRESRPSTRIAAREWFLRHSEPGSAILQEAYGAILTGTSLEVQEEFSLADRTDPCSYRTEGIRYLVVSSNIYDRYYREAERYADEIAFYETLNASPYQVHQESPSSTTGGPTIRIYDIRSCGVP